MYSSLTTDSSHRAGKYRNIVKMYSIFEKNLHLYFSTFINIWETINYLVNEIQEAFYLISYFGHNRLGFYGLANMSTIWNELILHIYSSLHPQQGRINWMHGYEVPVVGDKLNAIPLCPLCLDLLYCTLYPCFKINLKWYACFVLYQ